MKKKIIKILIVISCVLLILLGLYIFSGVSPISADVLMLQSVDFPVAQYGVFSALGLFTLLKMITEKSVQKRAVKLTGLFLGFCGAGYFLLIVNTAFPLYSDGIGGIILSLYSLARAVFGKENLFYTLFSIVVIITAINQFKPFINNKAAFIGSIMFYSIDLISITQKNLIKQLQDFQLINILTFINYLLPLHAILFVVTYYGLRQPAVVHQETNK